MKKGSIELQKEDTYYTNLLKLQEHEQLKVNIKFQWLYEKSIPVQFKMTCLRVKNYSTGSYMLVYVDGTSTSVNVRTLF